MDEVVLTYNSQNQKDINQNIALIKASDTDDEYIFVYDNYHNTKGKNFYLQVNRQLGAQQLNATLIEKGESISLNPNGTSMKISVVGDKIVVSVSDDNKQDEYIFKLYDEDGNPVKAKSIELCNPEERENFSETTVDVTEESKEETTIQQVAQEGQESETEITSEKQNAEDKTEYVTTQQETTGSDQKPQNYTTGILFALAAVLTVAAIVIIIQMKKKKQNLVPIHVESHGAFKIVEAVEELKINLKGKEIKKYKGNYRPYESEENYFFFKDDDVKIKKFDSTKNGFYLQKEKISHNKEFFNFFNKLKGEPGFIFSYTDDGTFRPIIGQFGAWGQMDCWFLDECCIDSIKKNIAYTFSIPGQTSSWKIVKTLVDRLINDVRITENKKYKLKEIQNQMDSISDEPDEEKFKDKWKDILIGLVKQRGVLLYGSGECGTLKTENYSVLEEIMKELIASKVEPAPQSAIKPEPANSPVMPPNISVSEKSNFPANAPSNSNGGIKFLQQMNATPVHLISPAASLYGISSDKASELQAKGCKVLEASPISKSFSECHLRIRLWKDAGYLLYEYSGKKCVCPNPLRFQGGLLRGKEMIDMQMDRFFDMFYGTSDERAQEIDLANFNGSYIAELEPAIVNQQKDENYDLVQKGKLYFHRQ